MKKVIVVFSVLVAAQALAAERDPLAALRFLTGEWSAVGQGKPGEATGVATFAGALNDTVITRTSYADYPATAQRPASRHEDLMVIYAEGGAIRADYFDTEGHVIRYAVRADEPNHAVFTSDPVTGQPRYRLEYALDADGRLNGTFDIAAPGSATFSRYLTWTSQPRDQHRLKSPK